MNKLTNEAKQAVAPNDRLTREETQDVLALHKAEQAAVATASPAVTDVAEVLDIPEEQVRELVRRVRARDNPLALARLKSKRRLMATSTAAIAGVAVLLFGHFLPNGPENPPFTVETVRVQAMPQGVFSNNPSTDVDVLLKYHPASLWRLLTGPHWDLHGGETIAVTDSSGTHVVYPTAGGASQGVANGRFYRVGLDGYHAWYEIPAQVKRGGATIQQSFPIDQTNEAVSIPVNDTP